MASLTAGCLNDPRVQVIEDDMGICKCLMCSWEPLISCLAGAATEDIYAAG